MKKLIFLIPLCFLLVGCGCISNEQLIKDRKFCNDKGFISYDIKSYRKVCIDKVVCRTEKISTTTPKNIDNSYALNCEEKCKKLFYNTEEKEQRLECLKLICK